MDRKLGREFPYGLVAKDLAVVTMWLDFDPRPQKLLHAAGEAKKEKKNKRKRKERRKEREKERERKEREKGEERKKRKLGRIGKY